MEYIIYCDESVSDGKYYTDFFGGVLVRNTDYDKVQRELNDMKQELNLNGEIKWIKVTENYLDKYKQMMNLFFTFIKENRLKVRMDDVVEINSSKHSIQQCMDIVLGSISFMLNKKNELIPEGATERGHRTIAKEKLFHHIFQLILECDCIEFFDISKTTPITVPKDFWTMPYRHWKFTTREYRTEGGADIKKEKSPA